MAELVRFEDPKGAITNLDLELAALVLQESGFPGISKALAWRTPTSGSDNTPNVAWSFKEFVTINPIIDDLTIIRSYNNRHRRLSQSVFYHPGSLNIMEDDAYQHFYLYPHLFLSLFNPTYNSQYPGSWQMCHLPTEIISSEISYLCRWPYEAVTSPT